MSWKGPDCRPAERPVACAAIGTLSARTRHTSAGSVRVPVGGWGLGMGPNGGSDLAVVARRAIPASRAAQRRPTTRPGAHARPSPTGRRCPRGSVRRRARAPAGSSSSARRRWSTARETTPTSRPSWTTGHALGVLLLEEPERLVERRVGVDRVVRLLGDLRHADRVRIEAAGDDLRDERLARDDSDERALVPDDVDGPHLGGRQHLTGLPRRRRGGERPGLRDHRVADACRRLVGHG